MKYATQIKGKEYSVIYKTNHPNPDIKNLYDDFKTSNNKALWLSENRTLLGKYDINVDALIKVWRNSIDYVEVRYLEETKTTLIELQDDR